MGSLEQLSAKTKLLENGTGQTSSVQEKASNFQSSKQRKLIKQIFLLVDIAFVKLLESFLDTFPFSFFSRVTETKGGTIFQASVSIQIRMLSYVISSALFGYYASKSRARKLLFFGIILTAFCQLALGLLGYVDDLTLFIVGASVSRFLYGVGKGGIGVSTNVIAIQEFPHMMSTAIGVIRAGAATGRLLGVSVGGVVYDHYGMAIPVIASSILQFLAAAIQYPLLCSNSDKHEEESKCEVNFNLRKYLSTPIVLTTLLFAFSSCGILAYVDVALTLYFERKGLSASLAGIGLMIKYTAFAGSAVVVGLVATHNANFSRFGVSIGGILYSVAAFAFTPNQSLAVVYISCFLLGAFFSISNVLSQEQSIELAINLFHGKPGDTALVGKAIGLWFAFDGFGMFILPIFVSFVQLQTSGTFTEALYGLAVLNIFFSIAQLISCVIFYYLPSSKRDYDDP